MTSCYPFFTPKKCIPQRACLHLTCLVSTILWIFSIANIFSLGVFGRTLLTILLFFLIKFSSTNMIGKPILASFWSSFGYRQNIKPGPPSHSNHDAALVRHRKSLHLSIVSIKYVSDDVSVSKTVENVDPFPLFETKYPLGLNSFH